MKSLSEQLVETLSETRFDLEYTEVRGDGRWTRVTRRAMTASGLAEACRAETPGIVNRRAYIHAPKTRMSQLVGELRTVLEPFIDPESDHLGLAFPIDGPRAGAVHRNGSKVQDFANSLVQAAAIIGVERTMQLLANWQAGEPIRFRTSTFVNGLILDGPLAPREDIEIVPLPLTTTELPRLPNRDNLFGEDYLGLTVLSLAMTASPALFRPKPDGTEAAVRSHTQTDIDIDVVCDALSLQANRHLSQSFLWTEYEDAAPFSLRDSITWSLGNNSLERALWKSKRIDPSTGKVKIEREDGASIASLDPGEVLQTIEAMQGSDGNLRIAIDRWKRSKRRTTQLEDRWIDLRIALETLYLKDFVNERSGELRFRLSLFGAWHLGATLDDRRRIRKTLCDAYDKASGAVHTGVVPRGSYDCFVRAQELCRDGILKLIRVGKPENWGDLILGASP